MLEVSLLGEQYVAGSTADVADVIACVNFAREHDMALAIRGGGHNAGGLGIWDDALVIDFGGLRSTTVNPAAHTVRVDAGCTWGDIDHATGAFGMATPSGFIASTGVGGQTVGGGLGYLSRRFGLSIDNLLSADVVLADGSFVTASHDSHPDLFWALRGGGGNFGVVTSFTFACHEIGEKGTVIAGPVLYDIADTEAVFRWYRELLPALPEELSGWIGVMVIPSAPPFPEELWGRKACGILWCYTGDTTRATRFWLRCVSSARRCWSDRSRCRTRSCRAHSTRCTRRGCSGTGRRTSSQR